MAGHKSRFSIYGSVLVSLVMLVFSKRRGYNSPKEIAFREELPPNLRAPIIEIVGRYFSDADVREAVEKALDPYGLEPSRLIELETPTGPPTQGAAPASGTKGYLLNCPWFQVYDMIERVLGPLEFYESEFINDLADPEQTSRAVPFRQEINDYFTYAGIGWQLVDGEFVTRGDEAFENTVKAAVVALEGDNKPTAAGHVQFAISALSARPTADTSGAVSHATSAVECVLGEITTGKKRGLSDYLRKNPDLFHPALKEGLGKIYAYASDVARHGKEGAEPDRDDAEFAVATCAAVCTLLTKKRRK